LVEGLDDREIVEKICSRFDVEEDTAKHDLADFMDRLADLGLLGE